nr:protein GPR15L [Dromaius novaehollandiae]
MKLLVLCSFLFVLLLCFNTFTVEGRKVKKICCSKLPKLNKKAQKGMNPKMTLMEIRKYCKPCPQAAPPVIPGPLPQLK